MTRRHTLLATARLSLVLATIALLAGCEGNGVGNGIFTPNEDKPLILGTRLAVDGVEVIAFNGQGFWMFSDIICTTGFMITPAVTMNVYVETTNVNDAFEVTAFTTFLGSENVGVLPVAPTYQVLGPPNKTVLYTQPGSAKGVIRYQFLIGRPGIDPGGQAESGFRGEGTAGRANRYRFSMTIQDSEQRGDQIEPIELIITDNSDTIRAEKC